MCDREYDRARVVRGETGREQVDIAEATCLGDGALSYSRAPIASFAVYLRVCVLTGGAVDLSILLRSVDTRVARQAGRLALESYSLLGLSEPSKGYGA